MNKFLALALCLIGSSVFSQVAPDTYLIQFTDKHNSSFSIDQPNDFLSQRAINRRIRYNIPVIEQDLPVNQDYISGVLKLGPKLHSVSKWFNSITIVAYNPVVLESVRSLPYVRSVKSYRELIKSQAKSKKLESSILKTAEDDYSFPDTSYYNYGQGSKQIGMLKGHTLHNQGYQGQGMHIAVLDGGFTKVDINPAFDSLWQNDQILGSWDYVMNAPLSYKAHSHGGQVLSIMAANLPGKFVGSAPKAKYYLFRTENGNYEYLVEEDNWLSAAEYADSAGVDLINSSLRYTAFNDPLTNHIYEDMDGNTTRITRAADIAASKGILVVSTAGNDAETDWRFVGAPSDADSILTVGAVDGDGIYASFSSVGPTYDGRIKPNVAAQGKATSFVGTDTNIYTGDGNSFSSPLMCGIAACLWQSNLEMNNMEVIEILQKSGSLALKPDFLLGYGIPDLQKAFFMIQGVEMEDLDDLTVSKIFPNPFYNSFSLDIFLPKPEQFVVEIWDLSGRQIYSKVYDPGFNSFQRIKVSEMDFLNPGMYIARIISGESVHQTRIIKQAIRQ